MPHTPITGFGVPARTIASWPRRTVRSTSPGLDLPHRVDEADVGGHVNGARPSNGSGCGSSPRSPVVSSPYAAVSWTHRHHDPRLRRAAPGPAGRPYRPRLGHPRQPAVLQLPQAPRPSARPGEELARAAGAGLDRLCAHERPPAAGHHPAGPLPQPVGGRDPRLALARRGRDLERARADRASQQQLLRPVRPARRRPARAGPQPQQRGGRDGPPRLALRRDRRRGPAGRNPGPRPARPGQWPRRLLGRGPGRR